MSRLFGLGLDPVTGDALGGLWRVHKTAAQRIAQRIHDLPAELIGTDREQEVSRITEQENDRKTPIAVTGFDLTFTLPKSASVLWALADPGHPNPDRESPRRGGRDCLALIETHALFTRTGKNGIAQRPTRGALAVGFDHWDTRTGDPNLHTHLVIANKVQGIDGGGAPSTPKASMPRRSRSRSSTTRWSPTKSRPRPAPAGRSGHAGSGRRCSRSTASRPICWPSFRTARCRSKPPCARCSPISTPATPDPRPGRRCCGSASTPPGCRGRSNTCGRCRSCSPAGATAQPRCCRPRSRNGSPG